MDQKESRKRKYSRTRSLEKLLVFCYNAVGDYMKKIVLTSCGLVNKELVDEFKKLFNKDPKDIKVLYIPVAIDGEDDDDIEWIDEELEYLFNIGIKKENFFEYKMDCEIDITKYDMIYMMGGNTFYLLKKIRETKFDKIIKEAIDSEIVYVGSSAGSEILGTTIEVALPYDIETHGLTNFTGLKLLNAVIIPHANRKNEFIKEQKKIYTETIYELFDEHGIIITDETIKEI